MKGLIFSIKRYSIHDGPGIRVTFFMKGCPLSCAWCHNPEGISPFPEIVSLANKVGNKEFSKDSEVGKYYTVDDIIAVAERERVFMSQSGGGVTFSGGEPMLQKDFLLEVLIALKENGYHTAIDTSGFAQMDGFMQIIPYTDVFLFDLKNIDKAEHLSSTGVSNSIILENYLFLLQNAKEVNIRIPVIPGYNDSPVQMKLMLDFIISTKTSVLKKVNLLPYHKIGSSKYTRFKMPDRMEGVEPPSKEKMKLLMELFLGIGVKVSIGG